MSSDVRTGFTPRGFLLSGAHESAEQATIPVLLRCSDDCRAMQLIMLNERPARARRALGWLASEGLLGRNSDESQTPTLDSIYEQSCTR